MEGEHFEDVPSMAAILLYFILGSVLADFIVPGRTLKMGQARNKLVLSRVAALELLCWWHSPPYPKMLAAAMGLQNARGALQAATEAGARCAPRT